MDSKAIYCANGNERVAIESNLKIYIVPKLITLRFFTLILSIIIVQAYEHVLLCLVPFRHFECQLLLCLCMQLGEAEKERRTGLTHQFLRMSYLALLGHNYSRASEERRKGVTMTWSLLHRQLIWTNIEKAIKTRLSSAMSLTEEPMCRQCLLFETRFPQSVTH